MTVESEVPDINNLLDAEPEMPPLGEHLWVAAVLYRVDPFYEGKQDMNAKNMLSISVGCYVCDSPLANNMQFRPCPGPTAEEQEWLKRLENQEQE